MIRSDQQTKSRYRVGGTSEITDKYIKWWERYDFPKDSSDVTFTLEPRYSRRPDLLAKDLFGTENLAWLILQYNDIVDINEEFIEGKSITTPLPSRVQRDFLIKK